MTAANPPRHPLSLSELRDGQRALLSDGKEAGSLPQVLWTLPLQSFSQAEGIYKIGSLVWDDETSSLCFLGGESYCTSLTGLLERGRCEGRDVNHCTAVQEMKIEADSKPISLWKILLAGVKLGPMFSEKNEIQFVLNWVKTTDTLN